MRKWMKLGGLLLVAAMALLSVSYVVSAQGPRGGSGGCPGCGMGFGGADHSLLAIAAKTLGMDQTELVAELNTGKTIADVAKTKKVDLDKIVEAFIADHQAMMALAVANGHMTQEQVDARLAIMRTNVTVQMSEKFTPNSNGMGFTDENGDGLCDHAGTMGGMMGSGMMHGGMMGNHRGHWNQQGQ